MTILDEIAQEREEILALPDSPEKYSLLAKLDELEDAAMQSSDSSELDNLLDEVKSNFSKQKSTLQIIKRKAMKSKIMPILLLGVGITLVVIGYKIWKKKKETE